MLDLTGMVRTHEYEWEVHMNRKHSLNAAQNVRRRVAYVRAPNAGEAMTMFHTVEIGIGGFAGAKYMAGHGVPFDVARRVLLKPGQRRSAKW